MAASEVILTVGEQILDILDEVLLEECGISRFEALYLGTGDPLYESELGYEAF